MVSKILTIMPVVSFQVKGRVIIAPFDHIFGKNDVAFILAQSLEQLCDVAECYDPISEMKRGLRQVY